MKKFMQQMSRVLVLALFANPILAYQTTPNQISGGVSYTTLNKLLIQNLPDESKAPETTEIKKEIILEIPEVSDRNKQEIICSLLDQAEPTSDNPLLVTLATDLELYSKLFSRLDHTVTTFGRVELAHILANPASLEVLTKRQAFIKELLTNEELFATLEALLKEVKTAEKGLFSFWNEENEVTKEYLEKQLFFTKSFLKQFNTNPYALETLTRLGNTGTVFTALQIPLTILGINYGSGKLIAKINKNRKESGAILRPDEKISYSLPEAFRSSATSIKDKFNAQYYKETYKNIKDTSRENLRDIYQQQQQVVDDATIEKQATKSALFGVTFTVAPTAYLVIMQCLNTKKAVQGAYKTQKAINYLHTKLIDVATLVNNCKELLRLSEVNNVFSEVLQLKNETLEVFKSQQAPFNILVQLLQKKTFKGKASFFSLSGRVLAAHTLMKMHKNDFALLFKTIGKIDAYISIAKLYKKYQAERVQFNFVKHIVTNKPVIKIEGLWHPLIPVENVVTNDIFLGSGAPSHNMILTGSNTAGKSSLLKALLFAELCAHTLTISPVTTMTTSYFDLLGSYLHMNDDISSGHSLFKAEVLRTQSLLENAQKLGTEHCGFVVIDELFTGTAADKGAQAAYKVAQHLTNLPNVVFILATHFPLLTELEKNSNGNCKNYKMEAIKQTNGSIVRPFKLEEGISTTSIANDILQEELQDLDFV